VAGDRNRFAELPTPSVLSILYAAILCIAVKDQVDSRVLSDWIANGAVLSDLPLGPAGGGIVLAALGASELAKMRPGSPEADYYDDLDGLAVDSLAAQAAEWALAGEVPTTSPDGYAVGTVAGGCFWGTELHFQRYSGVVATCVGYTQGNTASPSYEQVCGGSTGHTEGIQLLFDPAVVRYETLCKKLLTTVDATLRNQVGNDRGSQYRHGIYPHSEAQREVAEACLSQEQTRYARPVVTEVKSATVFFPAENYHQRYLQKGGQSAEKNAPAKVRCYG